MKIWVITLLLTVFGLGSVEAHPHVFITPKALIVLSGHTLSQVNVEWDFDPMSSAMFAESCGTDSQQIWSYVFPDMQLLANGGQAPRTGYYIHASIDGVVMENPTPTNFSADFVDGIMRCQFILVINQEINSSFTLWFDDATIYNAFDIQRGYFHVDDPSGASHRLDKIAEHNLDKICLTL